MNRNFEVLPGRPPTWDGMSHTAQVVAAFLARVRVTGDERAAIDVMAPLVACHQLNSEAPKTIERTPAQYAEHVRDMLATFGRFRYTVTEFLAEGERACVRWRQDGHHLLAADGTPGSGAPLSELGSAVYRVEGGLIAEYWIQLDRLGLQRQVEALTT